uniref:Uncharacterized protein n=1 Tax=Amphimedon queenslandica TaxID=400682 RepID=A0A1X7V769_AMPQE
MAAAIWGGGWMGSLVLFRSDNQAVLSALSSYSAKDPSLSHLLRILFFLEAQFDFEHQVVHVPGVDNGAADDLSRNHIIAFLFPQANPTPHFIPQPLVMLLSNRSLVWTSPEGRDLLQSSLKIVSQQEQ